VKGKNLSLRHRLKALEKRVKLFKRRNTPDATQWFKQDAERTARVLKFLIECGALPPVDELVEHLHEGLDLEEIMQRTYKD
jgi:hypothetical protein